MSKTYRLMAKIKTKEKSAPNECVTLETAELGKIEMFPIHPETDRIVRAALDLLTQKVADMDEDAVEILAAYSLSDNDVNKEQVSRLINSLFP